MNYYLSDSDVKVLKQTINTVNNLPNSLRMKSKPTIKHAFAYVELTEQNEDGLWSAKEVYFDETGTPSELVDGRTWGADSVYIIVNGTVSEGQVVRVEAYYMVDSSNAEQAVWVGSAIGGGGASMFRLLVNIDFTLPQNSSSTSVSLINDQNVIIAPSVQVWQKKFATADFYAGEYLYGISYSGGGYLLDPFLAGIGGV